ncbi:MAG: bifunctional 4-hydroxy-2-oxoglutarate aldolase/2-dehydro-3-deoxy-phosphogluconate aldolase [Clostridia bacterium]|nr:bifunctional 4-hydroxy-2-oxoglutarate aldolase/2-dehydro-3-deoxy-phosphogluconate aldolase [Clostridia bacterium]
MREQIIKKIEENKIIAIIRGLDTDAAVKTAKALAAGGITLIEVTFDQKHPDKFNMTAESIKSIKAALPEVSAGAGTVLTAEQADIAAAAGAEFIISPDADEAVIRHTVEIGLVSIPGAYTATEIKKAHTAGADFVKVFPCLAGAAEYIKAIKAPLSHIKLLAVGGVNAENCAGFLKAGAAGVGVGGSLIKRDLIENGEFDKITALAKIFVKNLKAQG